MKYWLQTRLICHLFGSHLWVMKTYVPELECFHSYRMILFFLNFFSRCSYSTSRISTSIPIYFSGIPLVFLLNLTLLYFFLYKMFSVSATPLYPNLAKVSNLILWASTEVNTSLYSNICYDNTLHVLMSVFIIRLWFPSREKSVFSWSLCPLSPWWWHSSHPICTCESKLWRHEWVTLKCKSSFEWDTSVSIPKKINNKK